MNNKIKNALNMNQLKFFCIGVVAIWCLFGLTRGETFQDISEIMVLVGDVDDILNNIQVVTTSNEACKNREGYFRDLKSCTRFYRCSNNMRYDFACSNGTVFDEKLSVCVWAHETPCVTI